MPGCPPRHVASLSRPVPTPQPQPHPPATPHSDHVTRILQRTIAAVAASYMYHVHVQSVILAGATAKHRLVRHLVRFVALLDLVHLLILVLRSLVQLTIRLQEENLLPNLLHLLH